ncbi:hypothetical protein PVAND_010901 [Polypedilum vanderplanki]|uniref:Pseudouridine-5'-phosphate glycosidase n=1 Tax=Polypedilum vanderplanki TaxID=319348 RepID=A0A9J6CHP3_POLVA|nr:hypothetical protein PVAND_010901 [Polypedilum vanderplanki]
MYRTCTLYSTYRRNLFNLRQLSSFLFDIKPEVHDALSNNRAVVALESTIITHGMPSPYNLKTAIEVEEIVREQGAIPATIAILNGKIKIGLSRSELEELAGCKTKVIKTSRRDLAYVLSQKLNGGTTVASTLICANLCGIKLFATGGIGGVHRNGEFTLDISADLIEMGKSSVAVVSSGIKSILDIPRTMEFLETQGVCVATFKCPDKEFPAFYTRASGTKAQYNFNDAADAAQCINKSIQLGLNSSTLIGVPVPKEHAMDEFVINNAIEKALVETDKKGIKGKEVTPYLLSAISEITKGKSLQTNMALIKENARVASKIAVELENLQNNNERVLRKNKNSVESSSAPLVIGGSILDIHYRVNEGEKPLEVSKCNKLTSFL